MSRYVQYAILQLYINLQFQKLKWSIKEKVNITINNKENKRNTETYKNKSASRKKVN